MVTLFTRFGLDAKLDVSLPTLDYVWDDVDPYRPIAVSNTITPESFSTISASGHVLYSTSCTELITHLLLPHAGTDTALITDYRDALWAAALSDNYYPPDEQAYEDYTEVAGPVWGMVALTFLNTLNTWYGADEQNSALDAAFSYNTVQHLLSSSAEFQRWTVFAIARLERYAPEDGRDEVFPLPIELLCPDVSAPQETWPTLLDRAVRKLNLIDNQYVRN